MNREQSVSPTAEILVEWESALQRKKLATLRAAAHIWAVCRYGGAHRESRCGYLDMLSEQ